MSTYSTLNLQTGLQFTFNQKGGSSMDSITTALGTRIKTLRKEKKITQKQLAEKMQVSQTAIALWESGQRGISLETLEKIAECMDLSSEDLLFGTPDSGINRYAGHPSGSSDFAERLTAYQTALLNVLNRLNDAGLEKVQAYAEDLSENPKYRKEK